MNHAYLLINFLVKEKIEYHLLFGLFVNKYTIHNVRFGLYINQILSVIIIHNICQVSILVTIKKSVFLNYIVSST